MKPVSICFVLQYLQIGGVETVVHAILNSLDRKEFAPVLICENAKGMRQNTFRALRVPIIELPGLGPVSRVIQARDTVRLFLRRCGKRFDILASFLATSHPMECYLAQFMARKGFMFSLVNKDHFGREKDWKRREKLADVIVPVSHLIADYYYRDTQLFAKSRVVYNGIDIEQFHPRLRLTRKRSEFGLPDNKVLFAYVARVLPNKGHDVLLESLRSIKRSTNAIHVVIAGPDKSNDWLPQNIRSAHLEDAVTYIGPTDDVSGLLSVCDGFILSSPAEAGPIAVLEAMASELPVIVTASGSEEFVRDGISGYVVPVGDAEGIAEAMLKLSTSPQLRQKMGAYGRKWIIENCSKQRMVEEYINIFRQIAAS